MFKEYRKQLIIGCALACFQQLSGINSFILYSTKIFKKAGGSAEESVYFTSALGFFNMVTTGFAVFLVGKCRRKLLLIQGSIGMSLCHFVLLYLFLIESKPWLQLIPILVFIAFFESSIGTILWIYCSEILIDKGVGIAIGIHWVIAAIIGLIFPYISDTRIYSLNLLFLIFFISCVSLSFFTKYWVVETKDLSLHQIELKFKRN